MIASMEYLDQDIHIFHFQLQSLFKIYPIWSKMGKKGKISRNVDLYASVLCRININKDNWH